MRHLDAFVIFAEVGKLGSISGAARALGLPKAKVSRAVSRLEEAYKITLLLRTTQRTQLTEAGRTLFTHCVDVLERMEVAEAELAAHRGVPAGTLRVGCSPDLSQDFLTPHIHRFLECYPGIDLRVRVAERLMPEPNTIDIVLHSGWLSDSRLMMRKLGEVDTLLVASRAYVERYGLPRSPHDMDGHRVIGNFYLDPAAGEPGRLPAYVPVLEVSRGQSRTPLPLWPRFASTDHRQILELVRHGMAIAPIARYRANRDLHSGELIRVLPEYDIHNPPALYALYTDRLAVAPKLQAFLEFLAQVQSLQQQEMADGG